MALSRVSRTKESFMEKITSQSESSQAGIAGAISNFENFSMEKYGKADLVSDLKTANDEETYDVLQAWINWNSKRASHTMAVYFSRVRKYLHYMGIKLHEQDIKNELDFKHSVSEELYGLTVSDIQKITKSMRYKHKTQFICQLSSLMRIGELVQLRKKHLITDQPNIIVKIPSGIAKFSKGRTTFFSKEASRLIRPMLKELNDNDLIFGTSDNPKYTSFKNSVYSRKSTEHVLGRNLVKNGLDEKYESNRRSKITTHSFRAFGITKLSRYDPNFAKKISGQKGYLLQYDRMSDEEKLELYQKYESDLTIDDYVKQKAEIERLEKEQKGLEQVHTDIQEMKKENSKLKTGFDKSDIQKLIREEISRASKQDTELIKELDEENNKLRARLKELDEK